jgi:AraC-like DNA-binding protein
MTDRFEFAMLQPADTLGRFVESIWYARGVIHYPRERIAPTGSTVGAFILGSPILQIPDDGAGRPLLAIRGFLIGPNDRPIVNEPTAETHCVGIVTTPVGTQAVFGVSPRSIRARAVELDDVWAGAPDIAAALRGAVVEGAAAVLGVLEARLEAQVGSAPPGLDRCERAVARLCADPAIRISDLADAERISHGHLDRLFDEVVGLAPTRLARVLRVRRLLDQLDVFGAPRWAQLAAADGWFDQAHLIRAFRRHTGVTPTEYVGAQRQHFTSGEAAPGFVPYA